MQVPDRLMRLGDDAPRDDLALRHRHLAGDEQPAVAPAARAKGRCCPPVPVPPPVPYRTMSLMLVSVSEVTPGMR